MTREIVDPSSTPKKVGRDYYLDHSSLLTPLAAQEDVILYNLGSADKARGVEQNISGVMNYIYADLKGYSQSPQISSRQISALLEEGDLSPRFNKRLGILYFNELPAGFDLVNGSTGEIIIPREAPAIELRVPTVAFPRGDANKIVTPGMISISLGLVADYARHRDIDFVIGLTHPRMGSIAERRWGFAISERPFPPEVYELLDMATVDEKKKKNVLYPDVVQDLEAFGRQVLVYQPKEDFINNPRFR